jgi:hypothetical protein
MSKPIAIIHLSKTLHLSQCHDGFWLYDDTRKMNLAVKEKTAQDALVYALTYYQDRLAEVEAKQGALHRVVDGFVQQLRGINNDEFDLIPVEETEDL